MNGINRNDEVKPILQNVTPINASVGGINGSAVNQTPLDSIMRLATGCSNLLLLESIKEVQLKQLNQLLITLIMLK